MGVQVNEQSEQTWNNMEQTKNYTLVLQDHGLDMATIFMILDRELATTAVYQKPPSHVVNMRHFTDNMAHQVCDGSQASK